MTHDKEFEEDDYDDTDEGAQQIAMDRGMSKLPMQYESEMLTHMLILSESEVANFLSERIENAPFFQSSVDALTGVVKTYITRSTVMANINNREYAFLNMRISLNEAMLAAYTHDTRQPDWQIITGLIEAAYDTLLTRAKGENRERILQNNNRVEVLAGKVQSEYQRQETTKKGINLPGFPR